MRFAFASQPILHRVSRDGRSFVGRDVVLVCLPNGSDYLRLGVVASRKVGGAVRRNRAKRVIRAAHRFIRMDDHLVPLDLIVIARIGAAGRSSRELRKQIRDLYQQAGAVSDSTPVSTSQGDFLWRDVQFLSRGFPHVAYR